MTPLKTLVRAYLANRGLFARIARKLGMDPSYVSRVAQGKRHNKRVSEAIEAELNRMQPAPRKVARSSGKGSARGPSKKSSRSTR